eukprot:TRINITY_DN5899_c0_g1_i1.p1 TRINITY_DN5899_c0_g1~~TRINITY_DN5899_c0_g1_i1.p1  ORF type:complete len:1100 (+),score=210.27 TRINITY_DN5899_c0_g1_i1:44-3343(+)
MSKAALVVVLVVLFTTCSLGCKVITVGNVTDKRVWTTADDKCWTQCPPQSVLHKVYSKRVANSNFRPYTFTCRDIGISMGTCSWTSSDWGSLSWSRGCKTDQEVIAGYRAEKVPAKGDRIHVFYCCNLSVPVTVTTTKNYGPTIYEGTIDTDFADDKLFYWVSSRRVAGQLDRTFTYRTRTMCADVTPAPSTSAPDTAAPPTAPPTSSPDTVAPDTAAPATPAPATDAPDTAAPRTDAPATNAPATTAPATDSPDTPAPDTSAPDTAAPDTSAPDTVAPDTSAPDTSAPDTVAPDTSAPDTSAPETVAPDTSAPDTSAPDTVAPDTSAPDTSAPDTVAPATNAPDTLAPNTPAPATDAPDTLAPTPAPATNAPDTPAPNTPAPDTPAPATSAPDTPAPATDAPDTPAPSTQAPVTNAPATNPPPTSPPATDAPPTIPPTAVPTAAPSTLVPTAEPTSAPSTSPPTATPTAVPRTAAPITLAPSTVTPTVPPTTIPTAIPSAVPTTAPTTATPTAPPIVPTAVPTAEPTAMPTNAPVTLPPTAVPTRSPFTATPSTLAPRTLTPTASPTPVPDTAPPTIVPTAQPNEASEKAAVPYTAVNNTEAEVYEAQKSAGGAVVGGAMLAGGGAAGTATTLLVAGHPCFITEEQKLPWPLHPTRWEIGNSMAAGVVVGNTVIITVMTLLGKLVVMGMAGSKWRLLEGLDAQGFLRFPSAPLFVFQWLYQGTTLGSATLIFYPKVHGAWILGLISMGGIIFVSLYTFRIIIRDVPSKAVYMTDSTTNNSVVVFIIGKGEWVSKNKECHWVLRHASMVRTFKQEMAWFSFIEYSMALTVSALLTFNTENYLQCGHEKLFSCIVFFMMAGLKLICRPHARERDNLLSGIIHMLMGFSLLLIAVAYYRNDTNGTEAVSAGYLSLAAIGALLVKVVMDMLTEAYIMYSKRRDRLQQSCWGQKQNDDIASEEGGVEDALLTEPLMPDMNLGEPVEPLTETDVSSPPSSQILSPVTPSVGLLPKRTRISIISLDPSKGSYFAGTSPLTPALQDRPRRRSIARGTVYRLPLTPQMTSVTATSSKSQFSTPKFSPVAPVPPDTKRSRALTTIVSM